MRPPVDHAQASEHRRGRAGPPGDGKRLPAHGTNAFGWGFLRGLLSTSRGPREPFVTALQILPVFRGLQAKYEALVCCFRALLCYPYGHNL